MADTSKAIADRTAWPAEEDRPAVGNSARAEAFRRLAEQHLDASYRLAQAIVGEPAEAEDATHDAFVTAWRHWGDLRDRDRFEPWFHRILVNTCRNRVRRRRWQIVDISARLEPVADDASPRVHDREVLRAGLARLKPDERALLALRYDRDLTVDAIAEVLTVPVGTVKSRLHRALRRLEAAVGPGGPHD